MNKYNGLLRHAAEEYGIVQGTSEDPDQWKIRIIYSILGRMALASLWDMTEDGNVSVVHMKRRVETLLQHFKELYSELGAMFPIDAKGFSDEIYNIYLNTGCIYHEPNRVVMASKSEATVDSIRFTRGFELEFRQKISGLGTYMKAIQPSDNKKLSDMFGLEPVPLTERWNRCMQAENWTEFQSDSNTEYLRMIPPFNRGYWIDKPELSGKVSLMRTGYKGSQLYYLYKSENRRIKVIQLPQWQVEDFNYRTLANACLCFEGTLPPSTYQYDGDLVKLKFSYLPPPAELYLWKLYSWPVSITALPRDFNRICTRAVFEAIKTVMKQQGYQFIEE